MLVLVSVMPARAYVQIGNYRVSEQAFRAWHLERKLIITGRSAKFSAAIGPEITHEIQQPTLNTP